MTERAVAQAFPGATALTMLDVYDWIAPDGLPGGSAHVHLASAERYVVLTGQGRLQTPDRSGYAESDLRPGAVLWFTPGVIHRLVNEAGRGGRHRGGSTAAAGPGHRGVSDAAFRGAGGAGVVLLTGVTP